MYQHAHCFWNSLIVATSLAATGAWAQPPAPAVEATTLSQEVERISLDWDLSVDELKVLDLEGRDIATEVAPRQEPGRISLAVPTQRPFVVKSEQIETRRISTEARQILPGGLFIPSNHGTPEVIGPPGFGITPLPARPAIWLRLIVEASPIPATWNPLNNTYHTVLSFGVYPSDEQIAPSLDLERPIEVMVRLRGLTTAEAMSPLLIESPGLANEKSIVLDFIPLTSTPTLEVRSTLSDVNLELEALPRLEIRPESTSMVGFGLARMTINVEQVAPHGEPLVATRPTRIALTVDGPATPDSGELRIEPDQYMTSFDLRSSGLAPLTLNAVAGSLRGEATIEQRFPWGPITAALFGGALGGFSRRFIKGARKKQTPLRLLEGVIVALIAYVAGVLGVGYLALPMALVATEAGAFLTGALSGFIGVNLLERLPGKASPKAG